MVDLERLRTEIESEMVAQLSHELQSVDANRVYVLFCSECEYSAGPWYGTYHPRFSTWFRRSIGARWNGLGPCWILNDSLIAEIADGCRKTFEEVAWNVSVHEAAHAVLHPPCMMPLVPSLDRKYKAKQIRSKDDQQPVDEVSESHGLSFMRVATHLAWRVAGNRGGSVSTATDVIGSKVLGFGEVTFLLRSELRSMRGVPLLEIARLPVPDGLAVEYQQRVSKLRDERGAAL